ncbi:hypothetical protein [Kordia sp.]|uniref:hypothetical protein n=1 Tax=Kordia sp. TaxID=1965332 RepID=UPI003D28ABEA
MKKQQEKNLLSLTKRKIASLNHVYGIYGGTGQGAGDFPTGGETTKPNVPVPDTYVLACIETSERYVLKKKGKGPVVDG